MDLRQVEMFLAVADHGSVTAAAEALHMSQPPLSVALAKLERELGVTLFERLPRGVRLTPQGAYLREAGLRLVHQRDIVQGNVRRMGEGLAGDLHVAVGPVVLTELVAPRIASFVRAAADVRLHLTDPAPGELLTRLELGRIDAGFVATADAGRFAREWAHDHHTHVLGEIPLALVSSGAEPGPRHLDDLGGAHWILPAVVDRFPGFHDALAAFLADHGLPQPQRVVTVSTPLVALPLVAAGVGVSLLPDRWIAGDARLHRIEDAAMPSLWGTLIWRKHSRVNPVVDLFVRHWLD